MTSKLLASQGEFRLVRRVDVHGRGRVAVEVAHADAASRARLGKLAQGHVLAAGDLVPIARLVETSDAAARVELECDGEATLDAILGAMHASGTKVAHARGVALTAGLLAMLARIQDLPDAPRLTAFGPDNIVVDAAGNFHIVGFGDNVLAADANGRPHFARGIVAAPEVAVGHPATHGSDLLAITLFVRAMIPYTDFPPYGARVFGNAPISARETEAAQLFLWSALAIVASMPERRPTAQEALDRARRAWQLVGIAPDSRGFQAFLASVLSTLPDVAPPVRTLFIRRDGSRGRFPDGRSIELSSRRPLQRIVSALCAARSEDKALSRADLIQRGWPGEGISEEAAAARLYVALSELRKLGFESIIQRFDAGWRIAPDVRVEWAG